MQKFDLLNIDENEKPLDKFVSNGGLVSIFRTIACIGDSLASGEFESLDENGKVGFHDYYEYSWGQFIARDAGNVVYNFSRGGMTASEYCDSFANKNDFWNIKYASQAYIIALGVNDINTYYDKFGSFQDVDFLDCEKNKESFIGYYCKIIQKVREIQPQSKIFVTTVPREWNKKEEDVKKFDKHAEFIRELPNRFKNLYVIDLRKYAPVYDEEFDKKYRMGGHLNPAGYLLTARMIESYIDYIIRSDYKNFSQVGFIGTGLYNVNEKPLY